MCHSDAKVDTLAKLELFVRNMTGITRPTIFDAR